VEWRASEVDLAIEGGRTDDDDVDSARERGRVDRRELLVVLIRGTDGADRASQIVHATRSAGQGDGGRNVWTIMCSAGPRGRDAPCMTRVQLRLPLPLEKSISVFEATRIARKVPLSAVSSHKILSCRVFSI
jgi:hypothetical protein